MASSTKMTEVESELLTDIEMLLMIEKCIRDGICHFIHWYENANNVNIKNYVKQNNNHILCSEIYVDYMDCLI